MSAEFLDSNVVLYLLSGDDPKRAIAKKLLSNDAVVSVHVLNETASVAKRKYRIDWDQLNGFIEDLLPILRVEPLTLHDHNSAREIAERYGLAFYDALIVASALGAECTTLYTEDMQHGQKIGDLTIVNPFR